ncbi:hypothetical protein BH11PLA2_BH11PLA2_38120 [soil metagenome]
MVHHVIEPLVADGDGERGQPSPYAQMGIVPILTTSLRITRSSG